MERSVQIDVSSPPFFFFYLSTMQNFLLLHLSFLENLLRIYILKFSRLPNYIFLNSNSIEWTRTKNSPVFFVIWKIFIFQKLDRWRRGKLSNKLGGSGFLRNGEQEEEEAHSTKIHPLPPASSLVLLSFSFRRQVAQGGNRFQ